MTIDLIFEIFLIPLLGILSTYLILFIKNKIATLQQQTENDTIDKYLNLIQQFQNSKTYWQVIEQYE